MANRYFNQFRKTLEKEQVTLFADVTFGSTGAPTLVAANSKGIKSIARVSAGKYNITLGLNASSAFVSNVDNYKKLFGVTAVFTNAAAPAAPLMWIVKASTTIGSGIIQIQFSNSAGTATDPASGEEVLLQFNLGNSTAI